MTTLTQVAITARKIIRYSIFFIIFLIVGRVVLSLGIGIFNKVFPAPPPAPTVIFGVLNKIPFPTNENLPKLEFTLQTPTGDLPKLVTQSKVYLMPKSEANLSSLENAKKKAYALGFTTDPVATSQTIYKFTNPTVPSTLQINIVSGVLSVSYDFTKDPSPLSTRAPNPEVAVSNVQGFLSSAGLLPEDINEGRVTHDFLKVQNQQLVPAISLSESSLIRINLFRSDYDKIPSLTPHTTQGNIWFLASGSTTRGQQVVAGEYRYFPIDQTQVSTYPLKTAKEAYDNLVNGKGYIADLGLNTNGKIIIRKIYLANYDPDTQTDFFQPIVVFEGDNGFVAYVPAVTDAYYQQK